MTITKFRRSFLLKTHLILILLPCVALGMGVAGDVYVFAAQTSVDRIEERLEAHLRESGMIRTEYEQLKDDLQRAAVVNENRLARLESYAEGNTYLLRGIGLSIALMLIKEVIMWRAVKIQANNEEEE